MNRDERRILQVNNTASATSCGIRYVLPLARVCLEMETAFPPDDIDACVAQPGFTEIGTVEELLA